MVVLLLGSRRSTRPSLAPRRVAWNRRESLAVAPGFGYTLLRARPSSHVDETPEARAREAESTRERAPALDAVRGGPAGHAESGGGTQRSAPARHQPRRHLLLPRPADPLDDGARALREPPRPRRRPADRRPRRRRPLREDRQARRPLRGGRVPARDGGIGPAR